jgi:hypothetical protein
MRRVNRSIIVTLVVGFVLSLGVSRMAAQTYVFGTASYPAPAIPLISPPQGNAPIITADFNGDGILDMAILGSTSSITEVSVFIAKTDGTFAPKADYPVPASGFTVGDFDGDSKLDIVVVNTNGYPVASILLGNGDGTFQSPAEMNLGIGNGFYSEVSSGDLNGDGKLDLVLLTPDYGSGATLAVLLGNGDGTFQSPVTYSLPIGPYLVIGDFNGDGKPDLAISGPTSNPNPVSVLINNGDGTFDSPVNYDVSGEVEALAVADLNGDGKLDLVAATGGQTSGVSVLLGLGDGTFASPVTYSSNLLSIYSTSIAVADFDGDGGLDLALITSSGANNVVAVLLGNGNGTFQSPPALYSGGLQPQAVVALDAKGDGRPDLAVVGAGASPSFASLTVVINRGDGSFPSRAALPVPKYAYSAVVGDFDGDGKPDIAIASETTDSTGQFTGGVISLLPGNGDGTFQPHLDSPTSNVPFEIAVGDFNGDATLDLVVAEETPFSSFLSTWIGSGNGTFSEGLGQVTSSTVRSIAVGDFNNDGKLDVAAVIDGTDAVSIFVGKGDGTFAGPVAYATAPMAGSPPYHNVLTADFNSDGKLDLAVTTDTGISILLGNGDGTFQAHQDILQGLVGQQQLIGIGDFDGNGKADLAIATGSNQISVALGHGDGTFQQATPFQASLSLYEQDAVVGDFNGDGKQDVAFASQSTDVVTVLLGNGDGTFERETDYAAGAVSSNVDFMVKANFSGDGALDLALTNYGDGTVSVFLNSPVAAFAPSRLSFGAQAIGASSPGQALTLTNSGAAPLTISSIIASGDFSSTSDCGSTLAVAAHCQVDVTFEPTAAGERLGTLSFTTNASVVPQVIPLSGLGGGPGARLSPTALTFTGQAVGSLSSAQTVTLHNTGNAALAIASIAVSGDFAQTNTCASSVAAGGSCAISVTFTPTAGGSRSGTLTITDNAADSPQAVSLTGTGQDFSVATASGSSSTATVTAGQTATYSLGLSGLGGLNQAINFTCAGAPSRATCTVNPPSVTPSGSGTTSITVTVTTTASSLAAPAERRSPPLLPDPAGRGLMLVLLGLLASVSLALSQAGRKPWRNGIRLGLWGAMLLSLALAVTACGGGGGFGRVPPSTGTPPGTYHLTVTGTLSGSASLQHSVTLTLNVE